MNENTYALVGTIIGLCLAWILNALGKWWGRKKENQLVKNHTLYNLLEIHYNFQLLKDDKKINIILEELEPYIPENEREEARSFLEPFYSQMLSETITEEVKENLIKMDESYTKSVSDLSKIDPIRAYRLNGKSNIFQAFDLIEKNFENLETDLSIDDDDDLEILDDIQDQITELSEPKIYADAIEDLHLEIKSISWSIGPFTWLRVRKVLNDFNISTTNEEKKLVKEFIKTILPVILASINNNNEVRK